MHHHSPPCEQQREPDPPPDIAAEWVNPSERGPTLVWIHGLGASSTGMFAPVAKHPALTGVRSLLLDLPGHGHSGKPKDWSYDIESHAAVLGQPLTKLCSKPVILLGHSLGGSVAIEMACTSPSQIACLIATEPTLDPTGGPLSARICRQSEEAFVASGYDTLLAATERLAGQGSRAAAEWLPSLKTALPEALHRSATAVRSQRSPTFREMISTLPMPIALIEGELSEFGKTAPSVPELRGYVVPRAGHHIASDNPDDFAAIIAEILALQNTRS